jgi:hypothetical protein
MNQRHLALLALASASVCAVVFTACGGDDTNNGDSGGGDATTNDVVATDTTPPNDTSTNDTGGNDGGTDGTTVDTGCAPGPNCGACCIQKYPDAAAFVVETERTCGCTTPGDCNTNQTCKNNFCNNQQANQACTACLNDKDSGDCRQAAGAACIQSPACQPFAQCVVQCGSAVTDAGGGG